MYDDTMTVDKAYYNKLKEQTTWVSVKDRLPEIADNSYTSDVLLCYSTDDGRMWFSTYEENGFGQRGFEVEKYYGVNVTHWMPLPEKPESEDDAE